MENIIKEIHNWIWIVLFVFCIFGLFYPLIGLLAIIFMLAPIIVAFFKGRLGCQKFCPRGSFNDVIISKIIKKSQ